MPQHPGLGQRRAPGRSRVAGWRRRSRVDGVRLQSAVVVGAAEDDVVGCAGSTYVGTCPGPLGQPPLARGRTARRRPPGRGPAVVDGVAGEGRDPRPEQFTTSGASGSRASAIRVTRAAGLVEHPLGSHAQVARHVDHRRHERPGVGVRRRWLARVRAPAPPRPTTDPGVGSAQQLGAAAHRRRRRRSSPGSRANSAYVAAAPGGDLVLREGEIGVPDRGRDARRRLEREVTSEHVDPVAGLEQPEGAAEADDPGADDDHPLRACGRVCRTG